MSGGYESTPRDAILAQIQMLWQAFNESRGANTLESATITGPDGFKAYDPETGARIQLARAFLQFVNDLVPGTGGSLSTTEGEAILQAWKQTGVLFGETSLRLVGKSDAAPGAAILRSGGDVFIRSTEAETEEPTGTVDLMGLKISLDASTLPIYSLPTTSATANVALTTVGGQWTLALVTSSRRYKTNIEPVAIDPASVLAVEVVKYNDVVDMGVEGFPAPDRYGVIAEQAHEHVPEFVPLDDEGRPNAFDYDRFSAVGHQIVLKDHEARLAELEAENAELRSTIAALTTRIEALEAQ